MCIIGLAMLPRPYATALSFLQDNYGWIITVPMLNTALIVFGAALLFVGEVKWWPFVLLFSPMWVYALCLFVLYIGDPTVGPMGWGFGLPFSLFALYRHAKTDVTRRLAKTLYESRLSPGNARVYEREGD